MKHPAPDNISEYFLVPPLLHLHLTEAVDNGFRPLHPKSSSWRSLRPFAAYRSRRGASTAPRRFLHKALAECYATPHAFTSSWTKFFGEKSSNGCRAAQRPPVAFLLPLVTSNYFRHYLACLLYLFSATTSIEWSFLYELNSPSMLSK